MGGAEYAAEESMWRDSDTRGAVVASQERGVTGFGTSGYVGDRRRRRHHLSTLFDTPMTNADNQTNPLLAASELPRFDQIEASHVEPAVRTMIDEITRGLETIETAPGATWDTLMQPLERLGDRVHRIWGPIGHLLTVRNTPELREAYESVQDDVVALGLRMSQSAPIYRALKSLRDGGAWSELGEARQRAVSQAILSAELSGVGLEGAPKVRFNEIATELSQLKTTFSNNVLDDMRAWYLDLATEEDAAGLPESARGMMAQSHRRSVEGSEASAERGPWRVTLDIPSYRAFIEYATRRDLRERVYRAFITRASTGERDNTPLIQRILALRAEMSALLGYKNYAELSMASKMATVEGVHGLLDDLTEAAYPHGEREHRELVAFAQARGHVGDLERWDATFWHRVMREETFAFTQEELKPYFPLPRVLDGLYALVQRLFGVRVVAADGEAPVWHPDVRFFRVHDSSGAQIAGFYLDPYSRPADKRGGAWMGTCIERMRKDDGSVQLPVAYLVCNGSPPVDDTPSLLTFDEVTTLYHEFGHGLHHMLSQVDESSVSGTSGVEWDAVELPSQFMENWCYHRETLLGMTSHIETGDVLPDAIFDKLVQARTFGSASMMLRQLLFGVTDMTLHSSFDPDGSRSVFDVMHEVAQRTQVAPLLSEDRFLCSFQHIFAGGYAAGYYSYKWAEVLSADAFAAFEEAGLDDDVALRETGARFRDTVLALGGSRHPTEVYRAFRGRDATIDALLRHHGLAAA